MEQNVPEALANVSAVIMENGIAFHAKVIGLPHFRVSLEQARREGFLLVLASKN